MIKIILHTFASKLFNALLNFGLVVLTARFLGAEVRGEISLLIATLYLFVLASGFVGGGAMIYLAPRFPRRQLLIFAYLWALFISVILVPFCLYWPGLPDPVLLHWVLLSLLFNLTAANRYMLIATEKIKTDNLLGILLNGVQLLCLGAFVFIANQSDLMAFVLVLYVSWGLALAVSGWHIRKIWSENNPTRWQVTGKAMLHFGFLSQGANLAQFFGYRIQFYLIGGFLGKDAVGVFSVAVALSEALWMITQSISLVQLSRISNMEDASQSTGWSIKLMKASMVLTLAALCVLLALPGYVFGWVFGQDFTALKPLIWRMAPGILALSMSNIIAHYYAGIGKVKVNLLISLLTMITVYLANLWLMSEDGLNGAAWASSVAYLLSAAVLVVYFLRSNHLRWQEVLPGRKDSLILRQLIEPYVRNYRNRP